MSNQPRKQTLYDTAQDRAMWRVIATASEL